MNTLKKNINEFHFKNIYKYVDWNVYRYTH